MDSSEKWGEPIPSYEESIQQTPNASTSESKAQYPAPSSSRQQLPQLLASVRTDRINNIINSYIDPLLESQALSGLYKTTIVLVPSNSTALQTTEKWQSDVIEGSGDSIAQNSVEAVTSFPDEDFVKFVRLHGEGYDFEFWRQPAVIRELESSLKSRLSATGHTVHDPDARRPEPPVVKAEPQPKPMRPKSKMGLFRRKAKEAILQPEATSPTPESHLPQPLAPGHVRVITGLEEIAIRFVTDAGLYDTKTGKAVVVHMEIGS